jgi:CRP/FNR family cyclic AMP-dependent transcriptional regulator
MSRPGAERGSQSEEAVRLVELVRREVPLFGDLGEDAAARLLSFFKGSRLGAGEELWHEGEPGGRLGFLLAGRLQLKKDTEFKGKQVVVGVLAPGAVVGELSFLEGNPSPLTVAALEDCQLVLLPRQDFARLEKNHPDLALSLLKSVLQAASRRLEKSYQRLAAIF